MQNYKKNLIFNGKPPAIYKKLKSLTFYWRKMIIFVVL